MKKLYITLLALVMNSFLVIAFDNITYYAFVDPQTRSLNTSYLPGSFTGQFGIGTLGDANYSVALVTEAGPHGLNPDLTISYNSNSGPGLAGYGWNLAGLSVIQRVGQDYYSDFNKTGIDLSSNDRFQLNGQRLTCVSGTYGSNLSEYRTREDIFSRVICYTNSYGPDKFEVKTRDGLTCEYGYTPDSHQKLTGVNETVSWYINKITDIYGNSMTYHYITRGSSLYVDLISYAGYTIQFYYKIKTDVITRYLKGKAITQDLLLDRVEIKYNSNTLRAYDFKYNFTSASHSKYSILNEIVLSGIGGSQLNSIACSYYMADDVSFTLTKTDPSNPDISGTSKIIRGDYDGDGKDDIYILKANGKDWMYYRNNGNDNYVLSASDSYLDFTIDNVMVTDLNADGKDDLILTDYQTDTSVHPPVSTGIYMCSISTGSNFEGLEIVSTASIEARIYYDNLFNLPTDFDGDGINDLLICKEGEYEIYSRGHGTLGTGMTKRYSGSIDTWGNKSYVADFNNDGKSDIWVVSSGGLTIYSLQGNTMVPIVMTGAPKLTDSYKIADFNGDGKTDVFVYGDTSGDYLQWQMYLSNGTSFTQFNIPQKKAYLKSDRVYTGDFNGDGMTDLMAATSQTSASSISFFITTEDGKNMTTWSYAAPDQSTNRYTIGDFDGDGRSDYLVTNTGDWTGYKCYREFLNPSIKLAWAADASNRKVHLEYKNVTQTGPGAIYQKGLGATFPVIDYQFPMQVVSSVLYDNGIGGLNPVSYSYTGAKLQVQKNAVLCFSSITSSDEVKGIKDEDQYGYSTTFFYPYKSSSIRKTTGGNLIKTSSLTWTQTVLDATSKRIFPYISLSTQTDALTGHSVSMGYTFDNYGSPTQIVKTFSNGISETTTSGYTNIVNTAEWKLGRLDHSTTTCSKSGETPVSKSLRYTYSTDGILKPDYVYHHEGTSLAYSENYDYDSKGNMTRVQTSGSSIGTSQTSYSYDSGGIRILTSTDPLGHVTTNTYDTYGRLYTEKDYLNNTNTYTYDALGRLLSVAGSDGSQVTDSYIWTGANKPSNGVWGKSGLGNNGSVMITWFDQLGRTIQTEKKGFGGSMLLTLTEYNSEGQVYRVSDPYFAGSSATWAETFSYDENGRIISVSRPTGRNTTYSYTNATVSMTTAGKTSSETYNADGTVASASDHGGSITYTYFPDHKIKTVVTEGNIQTSMQYNDAAGNRTRLNDPNAGIINYSYDSFGRVKSFTNARGQTTTYSYLDDGRINTIASPEGTTAYSYNTNKQLSGISSPNSVSRTYGYDTKGRITSIMESIAGSNFSVSFTYDGMGRLSTKTHPSGITETYGYNSSGYLSTISAQGSTRYTITSMNAREQLTGATYGSGTTLSATFGFDPYGYPTSSKAGSIQDYRYVFDALTGNLNSRQNYLRGQTETFLYDNLDRLQTVTGPRNLSMTYYDNGNMKTKSDIDGSSSFGYGEGAGPHALTSLTCSSGLIPATEQHAVYNSSGKVTSLTQGGYAATFLYNADNQRSKMTVTENGSAVLTRWYAGSSYIREVYGTVTAEYTYLGGDVYSAPVMAVTQNGVTNYYYLLRDYLGSVTHQVNTSNSVVEEYSFDAWGRRRNAADWTLETNDQSLNADRGFTGHEFLPYFSLYNMNGRLYDPLVGRFLSADPYIGDPVSTQSYNRYSYALNNPLKYTDPSGYNYKPIYWDEAIGGSIPSIRTYGRFDFSANRISGPAYYHYNWDQNRYLDQYGNFVSYNEVYHNYVVPNSSPDHLYSHVSSSGDYSTGQMIDGFRLNGVLYEFDKPVPYNQGFTAAINQGDYYEDPMFYINGGIGVASIGATIKGGYHISNELYHYTRSSGNLHLRGGKYWNNPFVNNSKTAIATRGGAWRTAGTKLGYAGIAVTTGDALLSGEFRTSQGINVAMTTLAIVVPGVGSIVAGLYFVTDLGFTLATGRGIGDRIDAATGGTYELYNGLY